MIIYYVNGDVDVKFSGKSFAPIDGSVSIQYSSLGGLITYLKYVNDTVHFSN